MEDKGSLTTQPTMTVVSPRTPIARAANLGHNPRPCWLTPSSRCSGTGSLVRLTGQKCGRLIHSLPPTPVVAQGESKGKRKKACMVRNMEMVEMVHNIHNLVVTTTIIFPLTSPQTLLL